MPARARTLVRNLVCMLVRALVQNLVGYLVGGLVQRDGRRGEEREKGEKKTHSV